MERSVELARNIQRKVCSGANRPDKGVHQAGFLVLRETSMPSCLIELGFITTADEERLLNDASRVDDIARGIYEGLRNIAINTINPSRFLIGLRIQNRCRLPR